MKIYVTFFIALSAGLLHVANAELNFNEFRRVEMISPPNDYIESSKEMGNNIKFKKAITKDNPLLLTVEIRPKDEDYLLFFTNDLDMCKTDYNARTWDYVAVRLFTTTMIPETRPICPVKSPQTYEILFGIHFMQTQLILQDFEYGEYEISYIVKSSEGDVVFSKLKYSFQYKEQFQPKD